MLSISQREYRDIARSNCGDHGIHSNPIVVVKTIDWLLLPDAVPMECGAKTFTTGVGLLQIGPTLVNCYFSSRTAGGMLTGDRVKSRCSSPKALAAAIELRIFVSLTIITQFPAAPGAPPDHRSHRLSGHHQGVASCHVPAVHPADPSA